VWGPQLHSRRRRRRGATKAEGMESMGCLPQWEAADGPRLWNFIN